MRAKRGARLAIGAIVRHRYDGARGVVVAVNNGRGTCPARFDDGEDKVQFGDLRSVRRGARGGVAGVNGDPQR